jgi:hypothetical protein
MRLSPTPLTQSENLLWAQRRRRSVGFKRKFPEIFRHVAMTARAAPKLGVLLHRHAGRKPPHIFRRNYAVFWEPKDLHVTVADRSDSKVTPEEDQQNVALINFSNC